MKGEQHFTGEVSTAESRKQVEGTKYKARLVKKQRETSGEPNGVLSSGCQCSLKLPPCAPNATTSANFPACANVSQILASALCVLAEGDGEGTKEHK